MRSGWFRAQVVVACHLSPWQHCGCLQAAGALGGCYFVWVCLCFEHWGSLPPHAPPAPPPGGGAQHHAPVHPVHMVVTRHVGSEAPCGHGRRSSSSCNSRSLPGARLAAAHASRCRAISPPEGGALEGGSASGHGGAADGTFGRGCGSNFDGTTVCAWPLPGRPTVAVISCTLGTGHIGHAAPQMPSRVSTAQASRLRCALMRASTPVTPLPWLPTPTSMLLGEEGAAAAGMQRQGGVVGLLDLPAAPVCDMCCGGVGCGGE